MVRRPRPRPNRNKDNTIYRTPFDYYYCKKCDNKTNHDISKNCLNCRDCAKKSKLPMPENLTK